MDEKKVGLISTFFTGVDIRLNIYRFNKDHNDTVNKCKHRLFKYKWKENLLNKRESKLKHDGELSNLCDIDIEEKNSKKLKYIS